MRKKIVSALTIVLLAILTFTFLRVHDQNVRAEQRRELRAKMREAYQTVSIAVDYAGTSGFTQADILSREKINAIDSIEKSKNDQEILGCIQNYLLAAEVLNASPSVESTENNSKYAKEASKNASTCLLEMK